jgi:hypothetical protein
MEEVCPISLACALVKNRMTASEPHPSRNSIELSTPADFVHPTSHSYRLSHPLWNVRFRRASRTVAACTPRGPLTVSDFPIACTLCLVQEGVIGTGWLRGLSPARGLVQTALPTSPGMVIKVSVQIPGVARIRLEGLVTWARVLECGMQWLHGHAALTEKGVLYETPR